MILSTNEKFSLNHALKEEFKKIYTFYVELDNKKVDSFWKNEFNNLYNLREKLKNNKILDDTYDKDIKELYKLINKNS